MISKEAAAQFLTQLQAKAEEFNKLVSTDNGDWVVKGFIDVFKSELSV